MRGFNYKKTAQALNLFARLEGGAINKMKSLKLIWLSDRLSLRRYGRTITADEYFALKNGPVASGTRDILEKNSFLPDSALEYSSNIIETTDQKHFRSIDAVNEKVFSKTDLAILHEIYSVYGKYDQFELSELSHRFPEWFRFKSALEQGISSRFRISQNDFFEKPLVQQNLFKEEAEELQNVREAFEQYQKHSEIIS